MLSTSSIVGVSLGSLYGGDFTQHGRRTTLIYFNVVSLVGTILSLFLNFKVICVGRLVFGIGAGVLLCATPKVMDEMIPN